MWSKIYFNENLIEKETEKAYLIKMPAKSNYKGFCFWHPKKLIRNEGGNGSFLSFSFTNEFEFKLIKHSNSKHNREILKETTIDVENIKEEFEVLNESIDTSKRRNKERSSKENEITYIIRKPAKIKYTEVKIDDELVV